MLQQDLVFVVGVKCLKKGHVLLQAAIRLLSAVFDTFDSDSATAARPLRQVRPNC